MESSVACDNFFLGIWHPTKTVRIEWVVPPSVAHVTRQGTNWFLASAASPLHAPGTGLIHSDPSGATALAFRGYLLSPPIHSYSETSRIQEYWRRQLFSEHNGVFAAAVIGQAGETLTLLTDHLGMGPLYYRNWGDAVIFSTNARYLAAADDIPDLLAWRCLLQSQFVSSDRSLTSSVRRVPAGKAVCFFRQGTRTISWFDFDGLPGGTKPVGRNALREVESAFQEAMDRCLLLADMDVVLPLSSGHDSRRILAALVHRCADFRAITARVFRVEHRDLDARFASQMAKEFGFPHTVVEPGTVSDYVAEDRVRRTLVDAETRLHTWVIRLMEALPRRPSLIFDGIVGDILGNPGFRMDGLYQSPENDLEIIARHCIGDIHDHYLRERTWPTASEVREDLKAYLRPFLPKGNIAEIAFLLLRQRRTIAPWSQHLMPPGHVAVCPFLDLGYLRQMLEFIPAAKHVTVFQRACLRAFWPRFYRYPGNRDIPGDLPPGSPQFANDRTLACLAQLREEVNVERGRSILNEYLRVKSIPGRIALSLSKWNRFLALHTSIYLLPFLELVSREVNHVSCWQSVEN